MAVAEVNVRMPKRAAMAAKDFMMVIREGMSSEIVSE